MANFGAWRNGYIGINNVNLSDHAREIALDTGVAELPNDVHGDFASVLTVGLETWTITATFLQDFAAAKVDATLSTVFGLGSTTPFQIEVGADATSSVATTNPRYSGQAILSSYKPLGGAHGSNLEAQATFKCASRLTRRTS